MQRFFFGRDGFSNERKSLLLRLLFQSWWMIPIQRYECFPNEKEWNGMEWNGMEWQIVKCEKWWERVQCTCSENRLGEYLARCHCFHQRCTVALNFLANAQFCMWFHRREREREREWKEEWTMMDNARCEQDWKRHLLCQFTIENLALLLPAPSLPLSNHFSIDLQWQYCRKSFHLIFKTS